MPKSRSPAMDRAFARAEPAATPPPELILLSRDITKGGVFGEVEDGIYPVWSEEDVVAVDKEDVEDLRLGMATCPIAPRVE